MTYEPHFYQTQMISWLKEREAAALFCGMGLGKSATTLTAAVELMLEGSCRGVLWVAPIRVLSISIVNEIAKWDHLKWLKVANLRTPEGIQAWKDGTADVYLINSELLPSVTRGTKKTLGFVEKHIKGFKDSQGRRRLPVDLLVIDEISTMKSPKSKRAAALRAFLFDIVDGSGKVKFRTPFKRRWGLTGTPAPNSYLDLHAQVRMLDGGKRLSPSFSTFKATYFTADYMGWKHEIKPGAKEKIDAKLSDLALVMRGEDFLTIPPVTHIDIPVSFGSSEAGKIYKKLEKELLVQLKTGTVEALSAATLVIKLQQLTSGCVFDAEREVHAIHDFKINALKKLRVKHKKEPMFIATTFTHERERILEAFPEACMFDEKRMDDWKAGKIPMWVADYRSVSHGINGLQESGRIAVWVTPPYSWEAYVQLNARFARTGQEAETFIYRILMDESIDWAVVEALRNKEEGNTGLMVALKALQQLRKTEKV